jgi:hypothetical protein
MPTLFANARNPATLLAAAFLTSIMFVSAAVGPLPIA